MHCKRKKRTRLGQIETGARVDRVCRTGFPELASTLVVTQRGGDHAHSNFWRRFSGFVYSGSLRRFTQVALVLFGHIEGSRQPLRPRYELELIQITHLVGKRDSSVPAFRIANSGLSCEKPSKGGRSHAVTNRTSLARSSLLKDDTASQK